jgi:hypothetical protein
MFRWSLASQSTMGGRHGSQFTVYKAKAVSSGAGRMQAMAKSSYPTKDAARKACEAGG